MTALATPREGHVAFVVAAQPGLAVKPMTLFVNKATIASDDHAALTWGPAQAGVASGVLDAVADGDGAQRALSTSSCSSSRCGWRPRRATPTPSTASTATATHEALRAGALCKPSIGRRPRGARGAVQRLLAPAVDARGLTRHDAATATVLSDAYVPGASRRGVAARPQRAVRVGVHVHLRRDDLEHAEVLVEHERRRFTLRIPSARLTPNWRATDPPASLSSG